VRPLIVGEHNPYGSDPHFALYPAPAGSAGARLAVILAMRRGQYLEAFDRVNLLTRDRWSLPLAREAAARLAHRRRVLLGAKVCAAHGVDFAPFHRVAGDGWWGVVLPHPSGRCRIWNDAGSSDLARAAVRKLLDGGD
jgi:hypothetical protein